MSTLTVIPLSTNFCQFQRRNKHPQSSVHKSRDYVLRRNNIGGSPLGLGRKGFSKGLKAISKEDREVDVVADSCIPDIQPPAEKPKGTPDLGTLWRRFVQVASPYWFSEDKGAARLRLFSVFALTLGTTGMSVLFNFLGRDFYNAIASKDQEAFTEQVLYYFGAIVAAIPVFVLRDFARDTLSLRWRAWMTNHYMERYFEDRRFYSIQSQSLIDNPDQRIVDDLNSFTATSLGFSLAIFNSVIDLASFSGILFGIYPPLFGVLLVYSLGGTAISIALGKDLVGLNFLQEKREADFRYGLVRVRENAESIAFYAGEKSETDLLLSRFKDSFKNFSSLLVTSRNLQFFTSGYRYLIQLLPAAVVAPLYFRGEIEFGVINQSFSAFNHVLTDFSIIVYQFQALTSFSATVDRLGEFNDLLQEREPSSQSEPASSLPEILLSDVRMSNGHKSAPNPTLLEVKKLTVYTPQYESELVKDLDLTVRQGDHLLIMGASGSGKTSLLRAISGLWRSGTGTITRYIDLPEGTAPEGPSLGGTGVGLGLDESGNVFFVPQKPYMVLGTLRQQMLYPTWARDFSTNEREEVAGFPNIQSPAGEPLTQNGSLFCEPESRPVPGDQELINVLQTVKLSHLLDRCNGLDSRVDWSSVLSLGEQQRLAFARLFLSRPQLALMDESTSALDEDTEAHLYSQVESLGVTFISVGHRSTLRQFHKLVLEIKPRDSQNNWSIAELK